MEIDLRSAERQIDDLIERRASELEQANAVAYAGVEKVRGYDLRRASRHRAEWAEFYRAQIRAAEAWRERAVENMGRVIDQGAGPADPIPGGRPHAR